MPTLRTQHPKQWRHTTALLLVAALAGCGDPLDVAQNPNAPDQGQVLATPADIEAAAGGSFLPAYDAQFGVNAVGQTDLDTYGTEVQMLVASFENSVWTANWGMVERSAIPRTAPNNTASDQYAKEYLRPWGYSYQAINLGRSVIERLDSPGFTLGSESRDARARAFSRFVQGFAYGTLALTYDSAAIIDETQPRSVVPPLTGYDEVRDKALALLDSAIRISTAAGVAFTLPQGWLGASGNALSNTQLAQLAHSYRAVIRSRTPRSPAERQAVDWPAVIADAEAGYRTTFSLYTDANAWASQGLNGAPGAFHQVNYFLFGMADTSGNYRTWLNSDLATRTPFTIETPDQRWWQASDGDPVECGLEYTRHYMVLCDPFQARAERGQWRWSRYVDSRYQAYFDATSVGEYPFLTRAEVDLTLAEAYLRTGQEGQAAALVNRTRVGNGHLPPVTAAGVPAGTGCVPQVPARTGDTYSLACGSLLEAIKYEKRMETPFTSYGNFFFDSRGWGDLTAGTPLQFAVPAQELAVRRKPFYTYGGESNIGGGPANGTAPVGTYGFGSDR